MSNYRANLRCNAASWSRADSKYRVDNWLTRFGQKAIQTI
jgi:hypothetical protein